MNHKRKRRGFVMFPKSNGFIVWNTNKTFTKGHAYVKSSKVARTLIYLSRKKKLPKNPYMTFNLIKISDDKNYIEKLEDLKESIMTHRDFERMVTGRSEIDVTKINR